MIQKIVDGICQALSREFTEQEYEIYTESVEQGLKVPCFSVIHSAFSIFLSQKNPMQNARQSWSGYTEPWS